MLNIAVLNIAARYVVMWTIPLHTFEVDCRVGGECGEVGCSKQGTGVMWDPAVHCSVLQCAGRSRANVGEAVWASRPGLRPK